MHPLEQTTAPLAPRGEGLPVWKLLAFTMAGFLTIMTETMPAGLLPQIGRGLGVSEALAGQWVTVYALGSVLAAVPVIVVTRGWRRLPLFLAAMGGLMIFNTITALSGDYGVALVARFGAGMAAGVVWGLFAGYVRRLVPPRLQGRALAIAGLGQPVALALGVPLGAWLGALFDWRGVFWMMSVVALLLSVWVWWVVPDFAGQSSRQRQSVRSVLMMPGIRRVLLVLFVWIWAHNTLYTYIAPYLAAAGVGLRVDGVLLVFGVASMLGIWATGLLVDRYLRVLTLASLLLFALAVLVLGLSRGSALAVLIGVVAWGLSFGGAPTLLQTALADTAGESADVAQSMLVTAFNLAVAGGGVLGGVLLKHQGADALPWALVVLAVCAWAMVCSARGHGFRPGGRAAVA